MADETRESPDKQETIVGLIAQYQRRLQVYIHGLVPHRSDAEEILQEVNLFVWRHVDEYQPGTEFGAWVYKIAYFHVLSHRKKLARQKLRFSDELVQQLAQSAVDGAEKTDLRQDALEACVKRLSEADRMLVYLRYQTEARVAEIAEQLQRSVQTVYRSLDRIHLALLECVRRRLAEEQA